MNLKKVFKAVTGALALCLLFAMASCANPSSGGSDNGGTVETEEQKSLYGTYWGSLTVAGQSYDMALVANGTSASLYSTMMTQSYPLVKYVKNADGTYTLHCYNSGENTAVDSTHVKVTFTLGENGAVTCVPLIVPMAAMAQFSTCTKGNAYNGEYGWGDGQQGQQGGKTTYPDVAQDTLYGSYWGKLNFGSLFDMCLVVSESKIILASSVMTNKYTNIVYSKDSSNKWSACCYADDDLNHGNKKVSVVFNTSVTPYQAVATIVPMSASSENLQIGEEYDYRWGGKDSEGVNKKTVNSSELAEKISLITENTDFIVNGTMSSEIITAVSEAIKNLNENLFITVDFSSTTNFTTVPDSAFDGCKQLSGIVLPDTITSIGNSAFNNDSNLKEFIIPSQTVSIGNNAFFNTSIKDVAIPDSVISLGTSSFGYSTVESVKFGNGLEEIPASAFFKTKLKSIVFGKNIKKIGNKSFSTCGGLTVINIPDTVEEIDDFAFQGCGNIESVNFGKNVKTIGKSAFNQCFKLNSVNIPDNIETIGQTAFSACVITEIELGSGLKDIYYDAFANNTSLTNVKISSKNLYYSTDGTMLYSKDGKTLISALNATGTVEIPSSVDTIADYGFYVSKNIGLKIPKTVTSIGKFAFNNSKIESVEFEEGSKLTVISENAFQKSSIKNISIPEGIKKIEKLAFNQCNVLEAVVIPSSVETIDPNAFSLTKKLKSVTFEDTTGSWYATSSTDYTGGEKIEGFPSSTDTAANATALNTTYKGKYLYKVSE